MGRQSFRQSGVSKPAGQSSTSTGHLDTNEASRSLLHQTMAPAALEGHATEQNPQLTPQLLAALQEVKTNPDQQPRDVAKDFAFLKAQANFKETYTADSSRKIKRSKQENRRNDDLVRRLAKRPGR